MTHTLHRTGSIEDLQDDFPVLIRTGPNRAGSAEALREILRLMHSHGAVIVSARGGKTFSGISTEVPVDDILESIKDGTALSGVFCRKSDVRRFLSDMYARDFGYSVVVEGLYDEVASCCKDVGLTPHTAHFSLGFWGKTNLLPTEPIIDMTTMCGHGMIPPALVESTAADIRDGRITIDEGARRIAKPCVCGIFNLTRGKRLIEILLEEE